MLRTDKIRYFLVAILLTAFGIANAQLDKTVWVKRFGGNGTNNFTTSTVFDSYNNSYTVGTFNQTLNLDAYSVVASPLTRAATVLFKMDENGNVKWVKQTKNGSDATSLPMGMIMIDNYLYIVISGNSNPVIYDNTHNITTYGSSDIVLVKTDLSGNFIWGKNLCYGATAQSPQLIVKDSSNNIVIIGSYTTSATFIDGSTFTSPYIVSQPLFFKVDTSGTLLLKKQIPCTYTSGAFGNNISMTCSDNAYYFSGTFRANLISDAGTITSVNNTANDVFLYATDYNGNGQWIRRFGGTLADNAIYPMVNENKVYFVEAYNSPTLLVDSLWGIQSVLPYTNHGTNTLDILYGYYDTLGTLQYCINYGGSNQDSRNSLPILYKNNFYFSFITESNGWNFGTIPITILGTQNAFIMKMTDNVPISVNSFKGNINDLSRELVIDNKNNFIQTYVTTSSTYQIDGVPYSRVGSVRDIVIVKYASNNQVLKKGNKVISSSGKLIKY